MDKQQIREIENGQVKVVDIAGGKRVRVTYLCVEGCGKQATKGGKCNGCATGKHRRVGEDVTNGEFVDDEGRRRFAYGATVKFMCIGKDNTCSSKRGAPGELCMSCTRMENEPNVGDTRENPETCAIQIWTDEKKWRKKCTTDGCNMVVLTSAKTCPAHRPVKSKK